MSAKLDTMSSLIPLPNGSMLFVFDGTWSSQGHVTHVDMSCCVFDGALGHILLIEGQRTDASPRREARSGLTASNIRLV